MDAAATAIKRTLAGESLDPLSRARRLPAQVEIALAAGEIPRSGGGEGAGAALGAARDIWGKIGAPYEAALARMSSALPAYRTDAGVDTRRASQVARLGIGGRRSLPALAIPALERLGRLLEAGHRR